MSRRKDDRPPREPSNPDADAPGGSAPTSFADHAQERGDIAPLADRGRRIALPAEPSPARAAKTRSDDGTASKRRPPQQTPRDANRKERRLLRSGELRPALRIDLHGMSRDQARKRVEHGLERARSKGARCVLVIHGKGLRSESGESVLARALADWLAEPPLHTIVEATAPANPADGGTGATYLLLRRRRGRG